MAVRLPFRFEPGDLMDVHGIARVLDHIDPDDDAVYHIRRIGGTDMLEVPDEDGFLRKPRAADILRLMAEGVAVIRRAELAGGKARERRRAKYDRAAARAADPVFELRVEWMCRYDRAPCNRSDRALGDHFRAQCADPAFSALPGVWRIDKHGRTVLWVRCGRTLRTWLDDRGQTDERLPGDGVSNTGKVVRKIRVDHDPEIVRHWVAVAHSAKHNLKQTWERYEGELARISRGDPTGRKDDERNPIIYPKPATPHVPMSYWAFRRLKVKTDAKAATAARYGDEAADKRFGGSGVSDTPTHIGSHCMMDDTPTPALAKIEIDGHVWVGQPTFTHIFDPFANLIPGWDLSWDPPSSATVLRTIAHASTPKTLPSDLAAKHPELASICYLGDGILKDNLSAHHTKTVVDALRDTGQDSHFTGSGRATDKSPMERSVGTILALAFKGLPTATDPVPLRRWQAGDPHPDLMPTIGRMRTLLTRAIATHHLAKSDAHSGRIPLMMFLKATASRKINVILDLDQFIASIGVVEYDATLTAHGVELFEGPYRLRWTDPMHGAALFERLRGTSRPSQRGGDSVSVKVKYHPDNLLYLRVWDRVEKRYVTLVCDRPDYARDMPKWMHDLIVSTFVTDARAFIDEGDLLEFRKRLFDQQAYVTQASEERERKIAARVKDSAVFKRVTGAIVRAEEEDPFGTTPAPDLSALDHIVGTQLASVTSLDAERETPRKAGADARSRTRQQPRKSAGANSPARHPPRSPASGKDPRDAGGTAAHPRPIDRPERPRPPSSRGRKWMNI